MADRYKILQAEKLLRLENIVERHLADGYELVGGVCVNTVFHRGMILAVVFYQAVVKYDPPNVP